MLMGCTSDAGKSFLAAGVCQLLANRGWRVAPFKAQNMSNHAAVTPNGCEIGRAQYLQALAARVTLEARMNPVLLKPMADTASQVVVLGQVDAVAGQMAWGKRSEALSSRDATISCPRDADPWSDPKGTPPRPGAAGLGAASGCLGRAPPAAPVAAASARCCQRGPTGRHPGDFPSRRLAATPQSTIAWYTSWRNSFRYCTRPGPGCCIIRMPNSSSLGSIQK
jgi:hypothetical protein